MVAAIAVPVPASPVKVKSAPVALVGSSGLASIVTDGLPVSIVQV